MTKGFKKGPLTDLQKKKFQRRLSHFFKDFKYRNNLLSKEVAEILGYTAPKFYEMESDWKPHSRFINSLEFLSTIAALENMPLSDFISYLEGKEDRFEAEKSGELNRKLYDWEKNVLEALDPIAVLVRKEFIEICKDSLTEGKAKLESLLELINILKSKDTETIKSLRDSLQILLAEKK